MNTYVYEYGENLYINLTNTCRCECAFCVRKQDTIMGGTNLWLDEDARAENVIAALKNYDLKAYKAVVFCGFGEPTANLDALMEIGRYLKEQGVLVRLNTNGHSSLYYGRDIVLELAEVIDIVSISLNECNAKDYQKIVKSEYGEKAYFAMLDFAKNCVKHIPQVVLTVVDIIPKEHIEECAKIAKELGAKFRIRHYTKY